MEDNINVLFWCRRQMIRDRGYSVWIINNHNNYVSYTGIFMTAIESLYTSVCLVKI